MTAARRDPAGSSRTVTALHVDWTACDGRGHCTELLPELLTADEWGYPRSIDGSKEPEVPAGLLPHARRAVQHCPRLALHLTRR